MKLEGNIFEAIFKERPNRFLAEVEIAGTNLQAHVPTSGRMKELLIPGNKVLVREKKSPGRKTNYELIMAYDGEIPVSIDSRLPNKLVLEALTNREVKEYVSYQNIYPEKYWDKTRIDFLLTNGNRQCFIEVKSVTLVKDRTALFPDAPTLRGVKHLRDLIRARYFGFESAVIFVIQRDDANTFSANRDTHPAFADTLLEAFNCGVLIIAYKCSVDITEIRLAGRVPVIFG